MKIMSALIGPKKIAPARGDSKKAQMAHLKKRNTRRKSIDARKQRKARFLKELQKCGTIDGAAAKCNIGRRTIYKLLQKSQPFWKLLGAQGVWSSIIRVPITFPPQKFKNGTLLSGMCVPDLQGTQGSFSFYSTAERKGGHIGGQQYKVRLKGGKIESKLTGPPGSDGHAMKCPFKIELDEESGKVTVTVGDQKAVVGRRE